MLRVNVGGTDYYVVKADVAYNICKSSGTAEILVDPNLKDEFLPFESVTLVYNGETVFSGVIDTLELSSFPFALRLNCHSNLLRAERTWFSTEYVSGGQSTSHWESFFLSLAGVTPVNIQDPGYPVYSGHAWSFVTAFEALKNTAQISDVRMYPVRDGTITVKPVNTGNPVLTFNYYESAEQSVSNDIIRNRAVVFGNGVVADVSNSNPYLVNEEIRTVAVSTSLIETQSEASRVANDMLTAFYAPLNIRTFVINGTPTLSLNDYVSTPLGDGAITSLKHTFDDKRYTTQITIGERCPSFFGLSSLFDTVPVFLSAINNGVWRTDSRGQSWTDISGVTLNGTTVYAIHHHDPYLWAITIRGVYRSEDKRGTWVTCSVPSSFEVDKNGTLYTVNKADLVFKDIVTDENLGTVYIVAHDTANNKIVVLFSSDNLNFNKIYMV